MLACREKFCLSNCVANSTLSAKTNVLKVRTAAGLAQNREGPLPALSRPWHSSCFCLLEIKSEH